MAAIAIRCHSDEHQRFRRSSPSLRATWHHIAKVCQAPSRKESGPSRVIPDRRLFSSGTARPQQGAPEPLRLNQVSVDSKSLRSSGRTTTALAPACESTWHLVVSTGFAKHRASERCPSRVVPNRSPFQAQHGAIAAGSSRAPEVCHPSLRTSRPNYGHSSSGLRAPLLLPRRRNRGGEQGGRPKKRPKGSQSPSEPRPAVRARMGRQAGAGAGGAQLRAIAGSWV